MSRGPSEGFSVSPAPEPPPRGSRTPAPPAPAIEARSRTLGAAERLATRAPGFMTRSLVALFLRIGLGLLFFLAGTAKLEGNRQAEKQQTDTFADKQVKLFAGTMLAGTRLVRPFAEVLPYAEWVIGALLILGLFTYGASVAAAILLLILHFGQLVLYLDPNKAAATRAMSLDLKTPLMLVYLAMACAVLWLHSTNFLSLDGLLFGWWRRPAREPGGATARA